MISPLAGQAALSAVLLATCLVADPVAGRSASVAPDVTVAEMPDAARDFPFEDLKGGRHQLSEFRGQAVVLEFWASWCVPCRKGFPFLERMKIRHETQGLKVIAITLETDDDAVAAFVASLPASFLVGRDRTGRAGELFEVAAMPTALLLDRDGRTIARFEGGSDVVHRRMEETIEAFLVGRNPAPAPSAGQRRKAAGNLRAWERAYLADPIMNLDGDILTRSIREHIHASKEGAAGDGGLSGGGCGCN